MLFFFGILVYSDYQFFCFGVVHCENIVIKVVNIGFKFAFRFNPSGIDIYWVW